MLQPGPLGQTTLKGSVMAANTVLASFILPAGFHLRLSSSHSSTLERYVYGVYMSEPPKAKSFVSPPVEQRQDDGGIVA